MRREPRPLTGRRVALIAAAIFALVLTPNIVLAVFAVRTFAGLVVPNSYVASQSFDRDRDAQEALGWRAAIAYADDRIDLALTEADGSTARPAALAVTLGRPTTARDDLALALEPTPDGYAAAAALAPGQWRAEIVATAADGTVFRQRHDLLVRAAP